MDLQPPPTTHGRSSSTAVTRRRTRSCDLLLRFLHSDSRSHCVLMSRRKIHGESKNVAGLDTGHLLPFVISQVRERLRAFPPRVPNHRSARIFLGNRNTAVQLA